MCAIWGFLQFMNGLLPMDLCICCFIPIQYHINVSNRQENIWNQVTIFWCPQNTRNHFSWKKTYSIIITKWNIKTFLTELFWKRKIYIRIANSPLDGFQSECFKKNHFKKTWLVYPWISIRALCIWQIFLDSLQKDVSKFFFCIKKREKNKAEKVVRKNVVRKWINLPTKTKWSNFLIA